MSNDCYVPELTRWQKIFCPCLDVTDRTVKTRTDDTALKKRNLTFRNNFLRRYFIQTTIQIDNNFSTAMIINNFEFANVTLNETEINECMSSIELTFSYRVSSWQWEIWWSLSNRVWWSLDVCDVFQRCWLISEHQQEHSFEPWSMLIGVWISSFQLKTRLSEKQTNETFSIVVLFVSRSRKKNKRRSLTRRHLLRFPLILTNRFDEKIRNSSFVIDERLDEKEKNFFFKEKNWKRKILEEDRAGSHHRIWTLRFSSLDEWSRKVEEEKSHLEFYRSNERTEFSSWSMKQFFCYKSLWIISLRSRSIFLNQTK